LQPLGAPKPPLRESPNTMKTNTKLPTRQRGSGSDRPRLLTPDDLAAILGVTKDYVHKVLVYQRRMEVVKVGGFVRFTQEAVDRYLQAQTREAAAR
jgi:excisionase family DNA binding protein